MMVLKTYFYLLLQSTIRIYIFMLLIYIVAGYFISNRQAKWYIFLAELCEPPMQWLRRITRGKLTIGMFDLTPIILFFGLEILRRILYYLFMVF